MFLLLSSVIDISIHYSALPGLFAKSYIYFIVVIVAHRVPEDMLSPS